MASRKGKVVCCLGLYKGVGVSDGSYTGSEYSISRCRVLESLFCVPETNVTLYHLYSKTKKEWDLRRQYQEEVARLSTWVPWS